MNQFAFQQPQWLLLLILSIPLVAMLTYARKRRVALIASMGGTRPTHRKLRDVFRVLAFVLLCLALARPGHSPRMESLSNSGRDVVFALDVSRSMLAQDAPPSRLEVAKQAIRDTLPAIPNQRVGLVVYAGSASILCPLTYDHDFLRYMLDQAHPRSVDFGGTTLQSAVEKVVDQVFLDGRKGVQDLIVLTDGGDHGSKMQRVAATLDENEVDILLIGIGDPNTGSPIPVKENGVMTKLTKDEQVILTKLDDASLRSFSNMSSRASYQPVATQAFSLGHLYQKFIIEKGSQASDSQNGTLVYQEAAQYFIIPAIILLILAECWGLTGLQLGHASALTLAFLLLSNPLEANTEEERTSPPSFEQALSFLSEKSYQDAEAEFSALYDVKVASSTDTKMLAVIQFNLGLSRQFQAELVEAEAPELAHQMAVNARLNYLRATRYNPQMKRAQSRIVANSTWIDSLYEEILERRKENQEIEQEIAKIVEILSQELQEQTQLREEIATLKSTKPEFAPTQESLTNTSAEVLKRMEVLHLRLLKQLPKEAPPITLMSDPILLAQQLIESQELAYKSLSAGESWLTTTRNQKNAIQFIEQILEILASNSQESSDEGDEAESDEESSEYEEMDENSESTVSDEAQQGDLAASSSMQGLPEPNYSAEDILEQEKGSLEFRQQKRANSNAAKVKDDY